MRTIRTERTARRTHRNQQAARVGIAVFAYLIGALAVTVGVPEWALVLPPVLLTIVIAVMPTE